MKNRIYSKKSNDLPSKTVICEFPNEIVMVSLNRFSPPKKKNPQPGLVEKA